jgi:hypothetical protein
MDVIDIARLILIEHHFLWIILMGLALWLWPKVNQWWTTSRQAKPRTAAELRVQLQEVEERIQSLNQPEARRKPTPGDQGKR